MHRKLDYTPKPEHRLTVHPRDPFLLTDGVIDKSLWYEAYREKTVGWAGAKRIEITIDLGQIYNVGYVNIYTVGCGQPDVDYLEYAVAASSIDGNRYSFSSLATSDGWDFGLNLTTPKVLKLTVEQSARYIKLYVRPTDYYFFTDEIEVIESQSAELESPSCYLSKDQMIDLVERVRQLQREMNILSARVQKSAQSLGEPTGDWQAIKKMVSQLSTKLTEEQISKAEADFARFRVKWLQSEYNTDWLCYQAEPMDILQYGDIPAKVPDDFQISFYQWQNEYGAAAFNLVNCSASQIMFKVNPSPLRYKDRAIDSKDIFELRRAVYVRVVNAGLVADPLVLQNSKPFPVAPGETVQMWLETYSKGLDPGEYAAALAVSAEGENISKTQHIVPIKLEVADRIFPEKAPFESYNCDYITRSDRFTRNNPKEAVADLKRHYTNAGVILPENIYGRRGTELAGQYILPSKLERELGLYKDSSIFLLWLGMDGGLKDHFGEFKTSDGEYNIKWKNNFKSFLGQLVAFMLHKGYSYDSFALYLYDEYIGDDFIYVAQLIRDFDPRLKIYANKWIESESRFRKVKDLIDIWCPHLPEVIANKNTFDQYRNLGNFDKIWCYNANIARPRFFSPQTTTIGKRWRGGPNATAFRTMPIVAKSIGMTGAGFWVYIDPNRAGWTENTMGDHGVVYDGAENPDKNCFPEVVVPSKRWQQWRQGIEDAVCLSGHKDLLDEFFQSPNSKLNSEYLTSLRRRADEKRDNQK